MGDLLTNIPHAIGSKIEGGNIDIVKEVEGGWCKMYTHKSLTRDYNYTLQKDRHP